MKKHHSKCRNRLKGEVPGNHSRKKVGELTTETGGVSEQKLWDSMLVRIRNCRDDYKLLKLYCKKHGLVHCVAGKRGDEALVHGDNWDEWYEVSGGEEALMLLSVGYSWVKEWSWVISTGAPRGNVAHFHKDNARSEALPKKYLAPVISHCRRPKSKERAYQVHEVARTDGDYIQRMDKDGGKWMEWVATPARMLVLPCEWKDLTAAQMRGLPPRDMVVKLEWVEKRVVQKDYLILHCWIVGCKKPRRWVNSDDCWKDCD